MTPLQEWLNDKAGEIVAWLWVVLSTLAFWVCANGIVICMLIYICTKSQKSLHSAVCMMLFYLVLCIAKLAVAGG